MSAQPPWIVQQTSTAPPAPGGYGPPPGTPGGWASGGPAGFPAQGAAPAWQPQQAPRKRTGLLIGLVVLALLVVGGGAGVAWLFFRASGDVLVAHVPADAVLYGHLDLDPSGANKLGILALVDRVNDAAGEQLVSIDGLLDEAQMEGGVDFATDIDPWLGTQIAIYATSLPVDSAPEDFAFVAAIDDADGAAAFIESQGTEGPWDAGEGRRGWVIDDAVVVAIDGELLYLGTPGTVAAGLGVTDGLAAQEGYRTAVDALPEGVLSLWLQTAAVVQSLQDDGVPVPDDLPESFAVGVSFAQGSIDVTTVAVGTEVVAADRVAPAELAALPAGGLVYGLLPDLGATLPRLLEAADDAARADAEAFGDTLAAEELPSALADQSLQQQLGSNVAEIAGWLGDLTVVLGYDPTQAADNAGLQLAVAVADEQAATELLDASLAALPQQEGLIVEPGRATAGDVVVEVVDGRLALTAGTLGAGTLGGDAAFSAAVDGLAGDPVLYVDVRGLVEAIAAFGLPDGDEQAQQVADVAGAFDSLVATYGVDGDVTTAVVRVGYGSDLQPVTGGGEGNPPDLDLGPFGTFEALFGDASSMDDFGEAFDDGFEEGPFGEERPGASGDEVRGTLQPATQPDPTSAEPFAYGDDSVLDALWDACAAGAYPACDELFLASGAGTDYELFALTCGDRNDPSGVECVELYGA